MADLVLHSFPKQERMQGWGQGAGPMKSRVPKHPAGKHLVAAAAVNLGHYLSTACLWQPTGRIPYNTVRSWHQISFLSAEREQKSWSKDLVSCSSLWGSLTSQLGGGSWETTLGSHFIKGSRTTEKMPYWKSASFVGPSHERFILYCPGEHSHCKILWT